MKIKATVLGSLRKAKSIKQSTIAKSCNRSISYVSKWESGEIHIPNRVLALYAYHLKMPLDEISQLIDDCQQMHLEYNSRNNNTNIYPDFYSQLRNALLSEYFEEQL